MEEEEIGNYKYINKKIQTTEEIFKYFKKEKLIKISSTLFPEQNLQQNDISLYNKGPQEDEIFEQNEQIRNNLRRGFSILEFLPNKKQISQQSENEIIISRKGLPKFFDLQRNSIEKNVDNSVANRLSQLILKPIYEAMIQGQIIHIYKLGKANGENAQVSYIQKLNKWIIASKNVSLLASSHTDLENELFKQQPKFGFALLIAQTWFNIIKQMDKDKLQELKIFMNEKTFVGEYCGNPNHQHLVKYSNIDLHFFGIVENYGSDACLPPDQSYQIFQKFGLTSVKIEKITTDNIHFKITITKLFDQVEQGSLEAEGEGAVCYFVSENQNAQQKTLILCKLKSLEYRILRKLREKLKTTLIKPQDYNKIFNKFKTEVQQLCEYNQPSKPLHYFYDLAYFIFKFVSSKLRQEDKRIISERYISFLEIAKWAFEENQEIDINEVKLQLKEKSINVEEIEHSQYEEQSQQSQQESQSLQLKIIIISPPYYKTQEFQTIEENFKIKIQKYYNPNDQSTDKLNIVNTFKVPKLKQLEKNIIAQNIFFISYGWKESEKQQIFEKIFDDRNNFNQNKTKHFAKEFFEFVAKYAKSEYISKEQIYQQIDIKYQEYKKDVIDFISDLSNSYQFKDKLIDFDNENNFHNSDNLCKIIEKIFHNILHQDVQKQKLVIFVPFTLPGTGKSYILDKIQDHNQIKKNEMTFRILSYDTICQKLIQQIQYVAQNYYKIYSQVQNQANEEYNNQLKNLLSIQDFKQKNIIFLDKNILPEQLNSIVSIIQVHTKIDYKIIGIIPKCQERHKITQGEFPFSMKYLYSCINRVFNREEHETLNADLEMRLLLCLQHFKAFKQFKLTQISMKQKQIDDFIEIEFHNEQNMPKIQKNLEIILQNFLERQIIIYQTNISKQDIKIQDPELREFIQYFYQQEFMYKEKGINDQINKIIMQFESIFDTFQQITKTVEEEQKVDDKKTLLLIIPLTIPATGKTSFINQFQEYNQNKKYSFRSISSDKIREELMNIHLQKQPNNTKQQAFDKTAKNSGKVFYDRLEILINQTKQIDQQQNIIFIDKNHPPSALNPLFEFLKKLKQNIYNINIKLIAIQPLCQIHYQIQNYQYPFSLNYLLTCITRCIRRKKHETLEGNPQHLINILFMFFKFFKNFDQKILDNFDHLIQVPFHYEDEMSEQIIPLQLKNLADKILQDQSHNTDENDKKIENFVIELYNQKSIDFDEYPFTDELFENFEKELIKCFIL